MKNKLAGIGLLTLLSGFCFTEATAQIAISADAQGRPLLSHNYIDVKGSPYLLPEWSKGYVKLQSGQEYEHIDLLYDQVSDQLIFKTADGLAQEFAIPAQEFIIQTGVKGDIYTDFRFVRGYKPIDGAAESSFYQVLTDGETKLLKRTSKALFEEIPYGSATKLKTFRENNYYYLVKAGNLVKLKTDKKAVLTALKDKKTELEKYLYVAGKDFNFKDDRALAELVAYYNNLP